MDDMIQQLKYHYEEEHPEIELPKDVKFNPEVDLA